MAPLPPTTPPYQPTAVGDTRFGCGYPGPHQAEPTSTDALVMAVDDLAVTCIRLSPVVYVLLSTLRIVEQRTLAIVADDGQATLDGGGKVRLMYVAPGADVALANLRLSNGNATALAMGGAIKNEGGTMKVLTCTFDHNFAKDGGAIACNFGTMDFQGCVFDRNHAKVRGGALSTDRSTVKIQLCAFDNNHAERDGGAIDTFGGEYGDTVEMHGCNITNCSAEVLPLPRSPACDNTPQLSPSPLACTEMGRRNLHGR